MRRVLTSILLLLSGLIAYWLVRPEITLFEILRIQNPGPVTVIDGRCALFLRNHFADAVWCAAAFLMADLLRDRRFPTFYPGFLLALPFASEFLQGAGILPGTLDWIDLSIYSVTLALFAARRSFACGNRRSISPAFSSSPSSS